MKASAEDKGVDLYVLERAFSSTHHGSEAVVRAHLVYVSVIMCMYFGHTISLIAPAPRPPLRSHTLRLLTGRPHALPSHIFTVYWSAYCSSRLCCVHTSPPPSTPTPSRPSSRTYANAVESGWRLAEATRDGPRRFVGCTVGITEALQKPELQD